MKIVAIIPARGGSKRLHRKNIYPIWGNPMLSWSIRAAQESKHIDEVWVTTEDKEIRQVALKYGAKVHDRNPALSGDKVYKMEAIRSCFADVDSGDDIVVSLQANSPEITPDILDDAIETFIREDRNELLSVSANLMQNAAFRIMKSWYVFQKDLSTKCGVYVCDIHDVHTIEDVQFIEGRTKK
jgi:N-acylneuraminate cytidylyltransferase